MNPLLIMKNVKSIMIIKTNNNGTEDREISKFNWEINLLHYSNRLA